MLGAHLVDMDVFDRILFWHDVFSFFFSGNFISNLAFFFLRFCSRWVLLVYIGMIPRPTVTTRIVIFLVQTMEPANAGEGTNVPVEAVRQEAKASNEPSEPWTRLERRYAKALNLGLHHFQRNPTYGAKFNNDPMFYKIVTVDSLNAAAIRACGAHFIDASCLTLQECPRATGKPWHVREVLLTHTQALMDLEVRTRKAIARGPFVVIHWGQKLGYRVCHLALKPKVLSLGGSWPLDDGYFT